MENNSIDLASSIILKQTKLEYVEEYRKIIPGIPIVLKYGFKGSFIFIMGVEHSNDPNSNTVAKIKETVLGYIKETPKEKRLIIVEGFSEVKPLCKGTFEQSIIEGGESMGLTFLAKKSNSEVISPEPTDKYIADQLLKEGFLKEEIILFFFLRQSIDIIRRSENLRGQENKYLIQFTNHIKENLELPWLNAFDGTDTNLIQIIKEINSIAKIHIGKELFRVENNVVLTNLTYDEANNHFFAPYPPKSDKIIITNKINSSQDHIREDRILREIYNAVKLNKSPLAVYGYSHVVKLKPALDYLYGKPLTNSYGSD
jgi:hypothetical protein